MEEGGVVGTIIPPRLEDAGLEDCALPPEAIKEAFFKAAQSLRSWASTDPHGEDDCVRDPEGPPVDGKPSDSLIGVTPVPDPPGPCGAQKGGGIPEVLEDEVGIIGVKGVDDDNGFDKLLGPDMVPVKEGTSCIDGLQGLNIQDNKKTEEEDDNNDEEKEKKLILAEAEAFI